MDTAYSKSYRNYFTNQRVSLSFKAQREKYNYTIGVNLDPSYSKSENFVGDTILSTLSRHVVNISPMALFNYRWNNRTNLRIRYTGTTSQPSMTQLQPVADVSDPLNTIIGNPDLNPQYTNNLFIRFQKFVPEQQRAFMYFMNIFILYLRFANINQTLLNSFLALIFSRIELNRRFNTLVAHDCRTARRSG